MDINIFTQIGFVVLVGLASKNAILIVEFAKQQREAGVAAREATLEACQLRLRPIMMTSLGLHPGVVPLVIARGAGAEMRRTLGTAVFSGMLGVTLFGIFLTPVFFMRHRLAGRHAAVPTRRLMRWIRFIALRILALGLIRLDARRGCCRPGTEHLRRRRRPVASQRTPNHEVSRHRVFPLLHRSSDLRLGAVDRHHAGRRRSRCSRCRSPSIPRSRRRRCEVSASYPGANAQVVADTVAAPIEQQVNGVENMLYMSSQCTNDGTYTLTVTFKLGIDLNMAQVLVQNRVALAMPILPDVVKQQGRDGRRRSRPAC